VLDLGERERDYLLAWVGENLTRVRRSASGQRPMYWILGIGFVMGLAAHAGGFLLKTSATTEPLLLVADLLYALGWAPWTSVVVVVFVQIWPEAKRRQSVQAGPRCLRGDGRPSGPSRKWPATTAAVLSSPLIALRTASRCPVAPSQERAVGR
jgi:hypothetical protein